MDRRTRAGLLGRLTVHMARSSRRMVDAVIEVVPHLPVRDRQTLHAHHPGLDDDQLAATLVANATRVTTAIGAAGGMLSTVERAAPPLLLTAPFQGAGATLAVLAAGVQL